MQVFNYGETEINYLKSQDAVLGAAMDRMGKVKRRVIPDLFTALIYSIIGQQISIKATATIWDRLLGKCGDITPEVIAQTGIEEIQQCGMTMRKAGYIKNAGEKVANGAVNLQELYNLPDDEVIIKMSALEGVGTWTAEMLLLNSMQRPDVVSWGDIAIRRGMENLYGVTKISKEQFNTYKKAYSPYGSVASIYLWELSFK